MNHLRPALLLAGLAIAASPVVAAAAPSAPTVAALPAVTKATSVTVTWSATTFDPLAAGASYTVALSAVTGGVEGAPVLTETPSTQATIALPANNTTYRVRVTASELPCKDPAPAAVCVDQATEPERVTGPPSSAVDVRTDRSAPSAKMALAGSAAWTSASTITTGLTATDASGLRMVLGNTPPACADPSTCGIPYAANPLYTLPAGDGAKTVYARIVDAAGNSVLVSDGIGLDTSTPELWAMADDLTVPAGATVQFGTRSATDSGSGLDEGSFAWSFCKGCPTAATGRAAARAFPAAGQFEVTLTARDAAGNVGSNSVVVTVSAPGPSGDGTGGAGAGGGVTAGGRLTLASARLEGAARVGTRLKVRVVLKRAAKVGVDIRALPVRGRAQLLKRFRSKVALTPGTKILRLAIPTRAATRTMIVTAGGERITFRVRIRPA